MLSNINGYNIKEEWFIGKGTFASVYKAEKDGKFFAIKIFQTELLKAEYKKFLDREIKALQKINHPQVVKFYESGTYKDKGFENFYIVMDFIEGNNLTAYIGNGDEKLIVDIVKSIILTLDSVHKEGVIHRDLKPDNIMVNTSGVPILLDFGLAKLIDYTSIIQTGNQVGTFHYMSPEQITDSKNIDPRSDYFAMGVILYQLLTGVIPFDAPNLPALMDQIQNRYPKTPSDINPSISNQTENVILKLLEKQPYARYQNALEFIDAFSEISVERKRRLDLGIRNYIRLLNTDKTIFQEAFNHELVDHVLYPANLFVRFHPTIKVIKDAKVSFTTDPSTNRLTYPAFSKTLGVQELPYSSGSETTPIQKKDFYSITQIQDYVKKVIDFQINAGVNELATPFFYAKDPTDEWFSINLKLLKETIDLRDKDYSEMPLWAGICMNIDNWHDEEIKNEILNKYVKNAPDGFFVYGDPINNSSNIVQLFHYADLLKKLQIASEVPVIASRVSGLGLILLCLGISGISSGISALDSFQESILCDVKKDYGPEPRYYIPELLSMVSLKKKVATKLIAIDKSSIGPELKCSCTYCSGIYSGTPLTQRNMKLHFLQRRKQELEEITAISAKDRLAYIDKKVNLAVQYAKTLSNEGIKVGDFSHLNIWKSLIQQFLKSS